jgi:hypothetical protein
MFRPTKPSSGRRKVLRAGVTYIIKLINVQVNKPVQLVIVGANNNQLNDMDTITHNAIFEVLIRQP